MIVAGFGFRTGATPASLADALTRAAGPKSPQVFASAAPKAEAEVFRTFAEASGARIVAVAGDALCAQQTLTHSDASQAAHGVGSVAEAAALAAAGSGGQLLGPRVVSADRMATCALAEGEGA